MKKIIYFTKTFIKYNPWRVLFSIVFIILTVFLFNFERKEIDKYFVYDHFYDQVGSTVYVVKKLGKGSGDFRILQYNEPLDIPNNILVIEESSDLFISFSFIYGIFLIFYLVSMFSESWEIRTIVKKYYKSQIIRHKDIDFIYFVLNGKVIKKVPVEKEGTYFDVVESLGNEIDNYLVSKNLLDDFRGTVMENREKSIDDILKN